MIQAQRLKSAQDLNLEKEHLCVLHDTDEERWQAASSVLRTAIEKGEKVIYIANRSTAEAAAHLLQEGIPTLSFYITGGHFELVTAQNTFLRDGSFDPSKAIALVERKKEEALAAGYRALRIAVDMSWVLDRPKGSELFLQFEASLNDIVQSGALHILCLYDRRRFTAPVLVHVLSAHRFIHFGPKVYRNFCFGAPPSFSCEASASTILSQWLEKLGKYHFTGASSAA